MNRTLTFAAAAIIVWIIGFLLVVGRGLLIPIVIAIFIWYLLNTANTAIRHIPMLGQRIPFWFSRLLAFLLVGLLVRILINILAENITQVMNASARYSENLIHIFNKIDAYFHIQILTKLDGFFNALSMQSILVNIYAVFSTLTSSAILITLYVVFLFVEQHFFKQKMQAIFPITQHEELFNNILMHIIKDTQTYLGIKTVLSLLTASMSFIIMKSVHLDFAAFWALLIFFLNFIPNIGAIIATAFPALLALIQFNTWLPFIVVSTGIVSIQFVVGNILEPRFLGRSLNLSPLVILFALALWGAIWGVLGMFLSVPITVVMMIIFAHFEKTRPIAILLSQDGHIQNVYATVPPYGHKK